MTTNLLALKTAIEEKAIQKFPFTLNNETYVLPHLLSFRRSAIMKTR